MAGAARPPIVPTLVAALSTPSQTTLATLIEEYEWDDKGILEALNELRVIFDAWQIECLPPLGEFGLDDDRVVRRRVSDNPLQLTIAELARGESESLEFKESLVLDVKKYLIGGQPLRQCYSSSVLNSSLKTIAAYLNSEGGVLLVGVSDQGRVVGISREFPIIPGAAKYDFDEWELYFRSMIEKNFYNGRSLSASVRIARVDHSEGTLARIVVGARRELCVLRTDDGDKLFIRAGNRTLSVGLAEIDRYFSMIKLYL